MLHIGPGPICAAGKNSCASASKHSALKPFPFSINSSGHAVSARTRPYGFWAYWRSITKWISAPRSSAPAVTAHFPELPSNVFWPLRPSPVPLWTPLTIRRVSTSMTCCAKIPYRRAPPATINNSWRILAMIFRPGRILLKRNHDEEVDAGSSSRSMPEPL